MTSDAFSELEWRGLVSESTEGLRDVLAREKVTLYIGFDPTAASLHVGSLLPMMALARMQRFGHSPIAIVGGGTGMIGDPSGKTAERQLLSLEQIDANLAGIRAQLAKVLDFDAPGNPARIVNNADWLRPLNYLDFLRDIGKYFTVNYMLAKESVKRRIEQEDGISYTEFSYLMLQSYDFLTLYDRYQCTLQMGGSDQWGNITAGCDLDPAAARRQGPRPGDAAGDDLVWREVREDRSRRCLARSGADLAFPLLPVLAEHRRPRCGEVPEVLHVPRPRRDSRRSRRRWRGRRSGATRSACWRAR